MSKKSWTILYGNLLYKMGNYFLDRQYKHLGSSLASSISYTFAFLGVKTFVDLNALLGTELVTYERCQTG